MNRIIQTIALIFLGCCSNVVFLELIVKYVKSKKVFDKCSNIFFRPYPGSGNIITFAQFLFIAIEGFINYYKWGSAQRRIPLKYYFFLLINNC